MRTIPLNSSKADSPAKPWQSKLTPYAREIAAWRGQKPPKTYAKIAAILAEKHGLSVHPDSVHSFVKVRSTVRPKQLKIAPHFLREGASPNEATNLGAKSNSKAAETTEIGWAPLDGIPPKSYPVVNPNQL